MILGTPENGSPSYLQTQINELPRVVKLIDRNDGGFVNDDLRPTPEQQQQVSCSSAAISWSA